MEVGYAGSVRALTFCGGGDFREAADVGWIACIVDGLCSEDKVLGN